jgi:hydroxymethylpyrimidine/phosphomethylpyrimidine kinase
VLKGGHAGDALDLFFDGELVVELRGTPVRTADTHGSGCVFSAAIAAGLARRLPLQEAVRQAKDFIQGAIEQALEVGEGHGPVNPMWERRIG